MIDYSTELGRRVLGLLDSEQVIWLTTVDSKGAPQPRPVWFLWDGSSLLVYSRPDAYKLRHLARNARVSLNFNSDPEAHQVAVLVGEARGRSGRAGGGPRVSLPGEVQGWDRRVGNDAGEFRGSLLRGCEGDAGASAGSVRRRGAPIPVSSTGMALTFPRGAWGGTGLYIKANHLESHFRLA